MLNIFFSYYNQNFIYKFASQSSLYWWFRLVKQSNKDI